MRWLFAMILCSWLLPGNLRAQPMSSEEAEISFFELESMFSVEIASRHRQTVEEAPSIVTVLTAQQIQSLGIRTLAEAFEYVPGFTVTKSTNGSHYMVVRGIMSFDGVLFMLDGIPVNDALDGAFNHYERPLDDVERIEFIRGPGSALYGGYALTGVINVITKKAAEVKGGWLRAGFGTVGLGDGNIKDAPDNLAPDEGLSDGGRQIGFGIGRQLSSYMNMAVFANVSHSDGDAFYIKSAPEAALINTTRYASGAGSEAADLLNLTANGNFHRLGFNASWDYRQIQPLLPETPFLIIPGAYQRTDHLFKSYLTYPFKIGKNHDFRSKLALALNQRETAGQIRLPYQRQDPNDILILLDFVDGLYETRRHSTLDMGLELADTWQMNKATTLDWGATVHQTTVTGIEREANFHYGVNNAPSVTGGRVENGIKTVGKDLLDRTDPPWITDQITADGAMASDLSRSAAAGYVQANRQMDRLNLTLGLRYDHFSDFGGNLSLRGAGVFKASDKLYLKLLYGEAFKPPAFATLYDQTTASRHVGIYGNKELAATTLRSGEFAVNYQASERLRAQFNLFYNKTEDEVVLNAQELWVNAGKRENYGFETEVFYTSSRHYTFMNYSYQQTEGIETGFIAALYPEHRLNLGEVYSFSKRFKGALTGQYFSSPPRADLPDENRPAIDAFLDIQTNVTYEWRRLKLNTGVKNLLDGQRFYPLPRSFGIEEDYPGEGRTVFMNLEYAWDF